MVSRLNATLVALGGFMVAVTAACTPPPAEQAATPAAATAQTPVQRGQYLVTLGGCHDCHTPKNFGPMGPEPDMTRQLAGHVSAEKIPQVPPGIIAPDGWGGLVSNGLTAWAGPWGVSFSRNLTPDTATGIGSWTEDMFIKTIRDGKHQGEGRALLPPMPWQMYRQATDDDLKAIFAYLKSIPAINNAVPEPIPPAGGPAPAQ